MDLVQDQTPTLDFQTLSDISFYSILIQKLFFTVINEVSGDIRLAFFIFFWRDDLHEKGYNQQWA